MTVSLHWELQQGEVENQLISCAADHSDVFEVMITKPGGIVGKNNWTPQLLSDTARMIKVDVAAASMLDLVLKGGKQTLEVQDMIEKGRAALGAA